MGECFMTSRGGSGEVENVLGNIAVSSSCCYILTKVMSSLGEPIDNCYVCCNDGGTWYNYHTNEKGYALFATTKGSSNITAWNNSVSGGWNIIDQTPVSSGAIDAPIGTKQQVNITLKDINTLNHVYESNVLNFRVLGRKTINKIQMVGGGGGGGNGSYNNLSRNYTDSKSIRYYIYMNIPMTNGGGGGAYNTVSNFSVNKNMVYSISIGPGGAVNSSGGTTSAFGYSALGGASGKTGGGSGSYKGGNGGKFTFNTTTWSTINTFNSTNNHNINIGITNSTGYQSSGDWYYISWSYSDFDNLCNISNLSGKKSNYHSSFAHGSGGAFYPSPSSVFYTIGSMDWEGDMMEDSYRPSRNFINYCNNNGGKGGYVTSSSGFIGQIQTYWNCYCNEPTGWGCGGYGYTGNGTAGVVIVNF